jgi:hypothetical protein
VIGNTAAPNLNALVNRFGLATQYFGVAHPSEPNYVALMGGNTFGIANDDPYYINKVAKPSLGSQLDKAGISWKAYLQGLPHPAYKSICYPAKCNGAPDQDPTPYNHFSLLQTIQRSLGVGCLEFTCDTANVKPVAPLFATTGSDSVATRPVAVPNLTTPTPSEPTSLTTNTPSAGGWSVVRSALRGTGDNSLGAVAASAPDDVWAVGNFLPDTATSNQDATLSLANHFDGKTWSVVATPNTGADFDTLFGVAAKGGKAWAVGVRLNSDFQDRALIEAWDGAHWTIADSPQPGSERNILFGASATSTSDVWAVGDQEGSNGRFETLVEHLASVTAVGDTVWAVGLYDTGGSRLTLAQRHHEP